jgi:diacylglycerol kinase (ATP)
LADRITVIVNPIAGGARPEVGRRRADLAVRRLSARGCEADVQITEGAGHARQIAASAVASGSRVIVAWGGDGTVHEVASAVAFRDVALAIVPSGSGNGLARELGIPFRPAAALEVAVSGRDRQIDVGELDGRLFVNVAGFGLDARIAHRFAAARRRRGFLRYLAIGARELIDCEPGEHTITIGGTAVRVKALLVAIANARQYGNRALIAPDASVDDGALDVIMVEHRPAWKALCQAPLLFAGRILSVPGVTAVRATAIEIASTREVLCHVDGEPFVGGALLRTRIHPRALRVKVPKLR